MQFSEYQRQAARTDQLADRDEAELRNDPLVVPLLGLVGEAGQLVSEFKRYFVRDDDRSHFADIVKEELGDILWYVSNVADKFGLNLDDIAFQNLVKVENRWPTRGANGKDGPSFFFDDKYAPEEQLPRETTLRFAEQSVDGRPVMRISFVKDDGDAGDVLTDNAYQDDGYRYHDAFHLAYAAVLGWSPVLRDVWKRKRRSNKVVDEVEDGGRAAVIEEGIAALVFSDAKDRDLYAASDKVDSMILRIIKNMSSHLEVSVRSFKEWQDAILQGYAVFRALNENAGGLVRMNMNERTVEYLGPAD